MTRVIIGKNSRVVVDPTAKIQLSSITEVYRAWGPLEWSFTYYC